MRFSTGAGAGGVHRAAGRSHCGARPVPGRSAWDAKGAVESSDDLLAACALRARTPGSRPGGTPEEISRGQVRTSGRRPRKRCRLDPCPNGASKKMARGDEGGRKCCGDTPQKTSSMPRWGMARSAAQPGAAPAARTCPRLISCGVPPGRRAERWRRFFEGRLVTRAAAKSLSAARIFPGERLCARSISRRRFAARDVSDFSGCWRGFGAAAAGPRRTQPRSVGRVTPNPPCRATCPASARPGSDAARVSGARGRRRYGPRGSVARCSSRGRSHTSRRSRSSGAG